KLQGERSESAASSCISMKSDVSMDHRINFKAGDSSPLHSKLQGERSESAAPSCISMKSDVSMDLPFNFKAGVSSPLHSVLQKAGDRMAKCIITDTG
ncbi:protein NLRC3-like isoform X1, partial [Clarias magur]